jgi:hypothetical protein
MSGLDYPTFMSDGTNDLATRLRTADSKELAELVKRRSEDLGPESVQQALRNSYVDGRVIGELLEHPRLRKYYEVRRSIAAHPRTPQARAVGLIAGLYWRDLLRIGADSRVQPVVRRAADQRLGERLGRLSVGEKLVMAREAGPGLIPRLLQEKDLRVLAALLDNPRLTEPMLAPLVHNSVAPPEVLELVAASRKWGTRYEVRLALCRNPATPEELALSLLVGLKKVDLRAIRFDRRVADSVRQRAQLLTE